MSKLLTPKEVSEKIGISTKTLGFWRWSNKGIPYSKVGRHVRYRPEDVEAFIQSQTKNIGGNKND